LLVVISGYAMRKGCRDLGMTNLPEFVFQGLHTFSTYGYREPQGHLCGVMLVKALLVSTTSMLFTEWTAANPPVLTRHGLAESLACRLESIFFDSDHA
jgi:hypothetical protein